LVAGEDADLAAERLKLQHGQRLYAGCQQSYDSLYADNGAICEQLGGVIHQLDGLEQVDPQLLEPLTAIKDALFCLEDAAGQLRQAADTVVFDEQRQQEVEERLKLITALQRKYRPEIADILLYKQQIDEELEQLGSSAVTLQKLEQQIEEQQQQVLAFGTELSTQRSQAAQRLQQVMEVELGGLAMPNARFEVQQRPLDKPGLCGLERVEFYFSANPGQQTRPLADTASGGELSRLMLALRKSAPAVDGLATMVFDEVDAGIGGVAASAVGEKLCAVAAGHQVLCITHLPQVAAYANQQLRVEKVVQDGNTTTKLHHLDHEGRVQELARMLGGAQLSSQTVAHARDLLRRCQKPTLFEEM
jgi:DNA repair protein RecN (Recombination protein N)